MNMSSILYDIPISASLDQPSYISVVFTVSWWCRMRLMTFGFLYPHGSMISTIICGVTMYVETEDIIFSVDLLCAIVQLVM